MALTEAFANTATISTSEYSLPNNSTTLTPRGEDGVFQLFLDLNAMVAGDIYELKLYEKVLSAGTQRLVDTWVFDGVQGKPHEVLPAFLLMHGWDFTLKRTAGADRSISWSIRQVS